MPNLQKLRRDLRRVSTAKKAKASAWFFKSNPGDYGHGDQFLGVTVPEQRQIAKQYYHLPLADVTKLLQSPWHEERLTAIFLLNRLFAKGDAQQQATTYKTYLRLSKYVNNWDIVDSSAPQIVGVFLLDKPRDVLYRLAKSKNIWERRMAIVATLTFIRNGQFADTLKIARLLLRDEHDLIHKATGWMLRVVGDVDRAVEAAFLKTNAAVMPRTMLRYAIEKFPAKTRQRYLRM